MGGSASTRGRTRAGPRKRRRRGARHSYSPRSGGTGFRGYATLKKVGTYQNWFEVYELTEGTYAIYEPYQFEEALSYLVVGAQRAALVDSGNGIGESPIRFFDMPSD